MKRVAVLAALSLVLVGSTRWIGSAQQDDPRFTGRSDTMDAKDLGIGRRSFEPGARSAWHSHDKGQLIFVERFVFSILPNNRERFAPIALPRE